MDPNSSLTSAVGALFQVRHFFFSLCIWCLFTTEKFLYTFWKFDFLPLSRQISSGYALFLTQFPTLPKLTCVLSASFFRKLSLKNRINVSFRTFKIRTFKLQYNVFVIWEYFFYWDWENITPLYCSMGVIISWKEPLFTSK